MRALMRAGLIGGCVAAADSMLTQLAMADLVVLRASEVVSPQRLAWNYGSVCN